VNDADGRGEPQLDGALADRQRVLRRRVNSAAHHGIDVDVKIGVFGQQLQLLVEHLQALLGHLVGHHVVDGDLQMVEPGAVQPLDPLRREQIAVGDHPRDHAALANVRHNQVEVGMQQRFAARNRDDGGPQTGELVEPLEHHVDGTGFEKSSNSLQ
jgi:hypothetical protein